MTQIKDEEISEEKRREVGKTWMDMDDKPSVTRGERSARRGGPGGNGKWGIGSQQGSGLTGGRGKRRWRAAGHSDDKTGKS